MVKQGILSRQPQKQKLGIDCKTELIISREFFFFFKILAVYENFHIGQVLCASCPDSRTLITGGTSTVSLEVRLMHAL